MIREGSSLHSILIAVRRYGRRFRRQITSVTALRGTVCRWTVVRWSADAADFEDELKKTPIGWSADERRILGFLLLSSSTFHFTLLNASLACGQKYITDFCSAKSIFRPLQRFFLCQKKRQKYVRKNKSWFFCHCCTQSTFFASIIIEQKINVPKILKNTHLDKMMTLTDKMAGKKVFGI